MSYQQSFTDMEYSNRKKKTKREEFLEMMDDIIPWDEWITIIMPFYPSGKRGRPTRGIETMLRMYLLQNWFNLSDEGIEDAIYDSYAFRKFMKIDFFNEQVPDATTLCKFRKLLVDNGIQKLYFKAISDFLREHGYMLKGGTIVDATIINASPSTKNAAKQRDPEMHQTKKGNQWHFGMKCHIGVTLLPEWCIPVKRPLPMSAILRLHQSFCAKTTSLLTAIRHTVRFTSAKRYLKTKTFQR